MLPHNTKSQIISTTPNLNESSNNYISINSEPILVKLLNNPLMTNTNKANDTTLNLNHLESQLTSNHSNASYTSEIVQLILVTIWILHLMINPNKVYDTTPYIN